MPRKLKRKKEAKKKKNIKFVTDALEFFNFFFCFRGERKASSEEKFLLKSFFTMHGWQGTRMEFQSLHLVQALN